MSRSEINCRESIADGAHSPCMSVAAQAQYDQFEFSDFIMLHCDSDSVLVVFAQPVIALLSFDGTVGLSGHTADQSNPA